MFNVRMAVALVASSTLALAAIGCGGSSNPVAPSQAGAAGQQSSLAASAVSAASVEAQGDCANDSKLIGLFEVSTDYRAGTWWYLSRNSLVAAGFTTDAALKAKFEQIYGTQFSTLAEAVETLVAGARSWDKNGNEWVCAYELRGTRASSGEPLINEIFYGISDDRLTKK